MIALIDNYDSFTFNLVQVLEMLGAKVAVFRNDQITLEGLATLSPEKIVISPGPCTPAEAGLSVEVVKRFSGLIPILGVCLGHQSIAMAFGGSVVRATEIVHGKASEIFHHGFGLYEGIENPFWATRYHSLVVDRQTLPDDLVVTAWTSDNVIMGIRHKTFSVEGVQFHPESILTKWGGALLRNFVVG